MNDGRPLTDLEKKLTCLVLVVILLFYGLAFLSPSVPVAHS